MILKINIHTIVHCLQLLNTAAHGLLPALFSRCRRQCNLANNTTICTNAALQQLATRPRVQSVNGKRQAIIVELRTGSLGMMESGSSGRTNHPTQTSKTCKQAPDAQIDGGSNGHAFGAESWGITVQHMFCKSQAACACLGAGVYMCMCLLVCMCMCRCVLVCKCVPVHACARACLRVCAHPSLPESMCDHLPQFGTMYNVLLAVSPTFWTRND